MSSTRKVAVVTGSSRGLGSVVALALARAGYDLAVCGRTAATHDRAEAVCHRIRAIGRRAVAIAADLADRDQVRGLVDEVRTKLEGIDVLVLNAARAPFKPLERLLSRELRELVDTNFVGNIRLVRETLPLLESDGGGAVVFVSSLGSRMAFPSYPLGSMKAAMEAAVRDLGTSLRPRGVAVNGVCAGLVATDSLKTLRLAWPEVTTVPDELVVDPEEVADVVLFLASPAARGLCGQTVVVDRGLSHRLVI